MTVSVCECKLGEGNSGKQNNTRESPCYRIMIITPWLSTHILWVKVVETLFSWWTSQRWGAFLSHASRLDSVWGSLSTSRGPSQWETGDLTKLFCSGLELTGHWYTLCVYQTRPPYDHIRSTEKDQMTPVWTQMNVVQDTKMVKYPSKLASMIDSCFFISHGFCLHCLSFS